VRTEEGHLVDVGVGGGQRGGPALVGDAEAVTGLGLQRGGALPARLRDVPGQRRRQLLVGGRAGRLDGHRDATRRVRLAGHPGGELGGAVAGEQQVGVRVDPAGQHGPTAGVEPGVGGRCRGGVAHPGHPVALQHDRGAGPGAELGVVRGQLTDAGHQNRS
jgi:hypothetical protein